MELLFLQPLFKERLWGGNRLKRAFGYNIPSNKTGECWAISAHNNGSTLINSGKFAGLSLTEVWQDYPELFANTRDRDFPLMVKIIDAAEDLSVQVHPDANYAKTHSEDSAKDECWLILDCKPQAQIIHGHSASSRTEFKQFATNNNWDTLLKKINVKPGDFFDVPAGTVHAIGAGNLILEIQQSSDTTYRIYDYARRDEQGNLRDLHLDEAYQVITAPAINNFTKPVTKSIGYSSQFTTLTNNRHFQVGQLDLDGCVKLTRQANFLLASVINGAAMLNGITIKTGDHFIIPNQVNELNFSGNAQIVISNEKI